MSVIKTFIRGVCATSIIAAITLWGGRRSDGWHDRARWPLWRLQQPSYVVLATNPVYALYPAGVPVQDLLLKTGTVPRLVCTIHGLRHAGAALSNVFTTTIQPT